MNLLQELLIAAKYDPKVGWPDTEQSSRHQVPRNTRVYTRTQDAQDRLDEVYKVVTCKMTCTAITHQLNKHRPANNRHHRATISSRLKVLVSDGKLKTVSVNKKKFYYK